jgi:monovalent cation:H+ antiporter-2, CPA2 family
MLQLPTLLIDLALILGAASVVTVLFKWIKQPVVLGYILAGFLIGPHFTGLPTIQDTKGVHVWAEAGVIFLLFGLGLEFSFRKLARVGAPASVAGMVEVVSMLGLGYLAGRVLGWSTMDSIFLGGVLSISSTTIIIRALDELKMKTRGFAALVFGVLIVEDLVAILLLVLLSTVAITQDLQGVALLGSVGKLAFFLTLWFVVGIFLVPSILRRVRVHLSEETTVIVSIGLCLAMVLLAVRVGFSPALGAFIMGSILAETPDAEKIEHLTRPIRDLFAAVFFVSVGMLIDPGVLVDYLGPILVITVLTIVGKIVSVTIGAMMAGRSMRHSLQAGFSLAQIGEFSFIIATLGLTLKVTSEFLYPITVAVSAITTFTTPYLIRLADPFDRWLENRMPAPWSNALVRYQSAFVRLAATGRWQQIAKRYASRIVLNGVIVTAIFLAVDSYAGSWILDLFPTRLVAHAVIVAIAIILSAPFLWAMALRESGLGSLREFHVERQHRGPILAIEISRLVIVVALIAILAGRLTTPLFGIVVAILCAVAMGFLFSRRLEKAYGWLEGRFLGNLTESDAAEKPALAPWDAHLVELLVEPNSPCVGKSLMELRVRETFGVTIARIERGKKRLTVPGRSEVLFPGDRLSVIGTDEQILRFTPLVQEQASEVLRGHGAEYALQRVELSGRWEFFGKTIRDSGLRERANGLVVGIERNGRRILNPDSMLTLQENDVLWFVGDPQEIQKLRASEPSQQP